MIHQCVYVNLIATIKMRFVVDVSSKVVFLLCPFSPSLLLLLFFSALNKTRGEGEKGTFQSLPSPQREKTMREERRRRRIRAF